ncbi:hypothetical protein FIV60_09915 [Salmonella enterica]|uniref:Uncharacterized protein n=3 Tax=Salmonella enterica TaxID=28901 RepID=A0A614UC87_SALSE|nr:MULTISPECIES: hypothetical protein [Enterobacteriaceae]EAW1156633.1 hypothetical protein [Salmonella enterica subsp. enterica]EBK1731738.1 hypothetical protein [Salmonella enterica subsp. enterica serovar Heidelberg]EBM7748088.1 hypothetical protein [Salmonella enterica subsp. enterica serovar Typhimurium]EBN0039981.1 hypothetical protein [Salmonella enterica subsp. enterica serovar Virchow]EDP9437416.1 hypothetical protein [Salmonella enterica subsp. enterica serovar Irumu]EDR0788869.1 hy
MKDHWSAPAFDTYGFRRSELKQLADKLGIDLSTPLEDVKPTSLNGVEQKPLSEADVEILKMEIDSLKKQVRKLENERPILINRYREDDPLYLAIKIRNQEWAKYDPDNDRQTRGNQTAIVRDLEDKGFSNVQAKSIEMVACPIKR